MSQSAQLLTFQLEQHTVGMALEQTQQDLRQT